MAQRGRKSALSLLEVAVTDICPRPQPPAELNDEERDEWVRMCNGLPEDFFSRPTQTILGQLCRHQIVAKRLAAMIHAKGTEKFDAKLRFLLREQRNESMIIIGLLRSLRLTPLSVKQGSRSPIAARDSMPRPWES
jgi:hypothetical protein